MPGPPIHGADGFAFKPATVYAPKEFVLRVFGEGFCII